MSAPELTEAEAAIVAAFEAAPVPPEVQEAARVVEEVARALWEAEMPHTTWIIQAPRLRRLATVAVAAYRAAQDGGACGDLSPSINFGGDSDAERLMCELPFGHGGAHQHDNGDGLPPTRWIARADALDPK